MLQKAYPWFFKHLLMHGACKAWVKGLDNPERFDLFLWVLNSCADKGRFKGAGPVVVIPGGTVPGRGHGACGPGEENKKVEWIIVH